MVKNITGASGNSVDIGFQCLLNLFNTNNNIAIEKGSDISVGDAMRIGNISITYADIQI